MRGALVAFGLVVLLVGCTSNAGEIREVQRPAPAPPPAQRRFELIETATIETANSVELWFPLASSEPGVQEIERLDLTIKPDTPYEVSSDSRGNRMLHLLRAGPVAVTVAYRVLRTEVVVDRSKAEKRPLTETERLTLAPDIDPTSGRPTRRVATLGDTWVQVYEPGLAWVSVKPIPLDQIIVAYGTDRAKPFAKVDSREAAPALGFKARELDAP